MDAQKAFETLFRVREDLKAIVNREPPAEEALREAANDALPHIHAAVGLVDFAAPENRQNYIPVVAREYSKGLDTRAEQKLAREDESWIHGNTPSPEAALRLFRLIRNDLRSLEFGGLVQDEIEEALLPICAAISGLLIAEI